MRRQLSGRRNFPTRIGDVDLAEFGKLFGGNGAASQDVDLAFSNRDNCGFNSVRRWPGIDNQWDSAAEFIENMLRNRWTDPAEPVRARRSKRPTKCANDLSKHWMLADSYRDCFQTGGDNFGNNFTFRQNHCEWAGPKLVGQLQNQLLIQLRNIDNFLQPIAIGQMNNERIKSRTFFSFENFRDGHRVECISGESVNCFRLPSDDFVFSK